MSRHLEVFWTSIRPNVDLLYLLSLQIYKQFAPNSCNKMYIIWRFRNKMCEATCNLNNKNNTYIIYNIPGHEYTNRCRQ